MLLIEIEEKGEFRSDPSCFEYMEKRFVRSWKYETRNSVRFLR